MHELVALAEQGHWLTAVRSMFKDSNPELYDYAADVNRASWIPILPIGPHSTVLDVSSGLGTGCSDPCLGLELSPRCVSRIGRGHGSLCQGQA